MKETLREKADNMTKVYDELRRKYRWKSNDISIRFAAFIISLTDTPFDIDKYDTVVGDIKKNTGIFSYYRSTLLYPIAALLMGRDGNPGQNAIDLLECDRRMKDLGFKRTVYLGIAAYALLSTCPKNDMEARIGRAREIYKRMKENHYWLTTSDDYAVAVLLSGEGDTVDNLVERMERNFDELHKEGFRRSNGLQFLSHLLTFSSEPVEDKAILCREIIEYLKEHKLPVSSMYYGTIGLLALLGQESKRALGELTEMVDYMKANKSLKWYYKEINILMVSALVSNEFVEEKKRQQSISTTSVGISIQALIAAQTAAMIAAVTAATSAATAGSTTQ